MDAAVIMAPLTLSDMPLLVVAWERAGSYDEAVDLALRWLAHRGARIVVENVFAKLQAAGLLPPLVCAARGRPSLHVPCVAETCCHCGARLSGQPRPLRSARALVAKQVGLQEVTFETKHCDRCGSSFSSCWRISPAGLLYLCCDPTHLDFVQSLAQPRSDSVAFVDVAILRLCTSLVLRLRASFIGIVQVLQDTVAEELPLTFRQELFSLWLWWQSCSVLPVADMRDVPFAFSHNQRHGVRAWLAQLAPRLQRTHLETWGRGHGCTVCRTCSSVGIDGKISISAAVCGCATGHAVRFEEVGVTVERGCENPPARGARFCGEHADLGRDAGRVAPLLCLADHALVFVAVDAAWHHACDSCCVDLPSGTSLWRCDICDFDLCVACAAPPSLSQPPPVSGTASRVGPPVAPTTPPSSDVVVVPDDDSPQAEMDNPCGLTKGEMPGRLRRQGGLLTAMLACGRVVNLHLHMGAESPTQVLALLGEIRRVRCFDYIIYDNACHLARFVRKRASRPPVRSLLAQLAAGTYVLDRFHRGNHTACVDPSSRYYLPEVQVERHPRLAALNSSWSESWNAWLDVLAPQIRAMDAQSLHVYLWLLADLWNRRVLRPSSSVPAVHTPGPVARHLLRRRRAAGEDPALPASASTLPSASASSS